MRAQILYGIGNLKYAEPEKPSPKEGEALVKVECCGICGSDVPRIYKTGAHNMPLIPGHEFSGIVEKCPDDPGLEGKRVGVFPLVPCKKCRQCRRGYYEMCENYNYLGSRSDGGFAEYAVVPVWNLVLLPDEISYEEAAMLEPMCVAIHAVRRSGLKAPDPNLPGPSIVVCGLGTIGLLLTKILQKSGYDNILLIGNKDIQKKLVNKMGFLEDNYLDVRYADPVNFIMEKTGGLGADYYFECIGRSESYQQAVKCASPLAKVVLVGNPTSDMELPKDIYWKILRNQMTLLGTWNSSYKSEDPEDDDWQMALSMFDGSFSPKDLITHRFSLEELDKGLSIMRRKSEDYVKIMIYCSR